MQTIELETHIDEGGRIYLPKKFHHVYGKQVHVVLSLQDTVETASIKRKPGSAKGKLKIVEEDESHLNDFKDYMP